ncbi:hypothetical protein [Paenibacillus xylanexedens]|uniref:hypothetical protein n=1 Tax=Paenibacillus xylanexedens TaxID=528191 RepID=UPI000F53EB10|nr:hypothetical protein [Paenibacillus xylanexedens]RPK31815.1 hypothetical protein EDO6_02442 [Paenibacillus xylanexedens]
MNNPYDYMERKNEIINSVKKSDEEIMESLLRLLSDMAVEFDIPLNYGEDYKNRNIETISVFDEIKNEIVKRRVIH